MTENCKPLNTNTKYGEANVLTPEVGELQITIRLANLYYENSMKQFQGYNESHPHGICNIHVDMRRLYMGTNGWFFIISVQSTID